MQLPYERFGLAPFAGLEICISGYAKKKAQMGALINQYGGRYNAELNKATCHVLVCEVPSGQKYKYVVLMFYSKTLQSPLPVMLTLP